ncbi:MAG: hypothetical protein HY290_26520 [Planctomycetia bacterium]|nr:hypothetical protein [Planctomycetia bacterium]
MSESALQTGSSASTPVPPSEGVRVRAGKGAETVINPERRAAPGALVTVAAGEAPPSSIGSAAKSGIVRMLFPPEDEAAVQTFDAETG